LAEPHEPSPSTEELRTRVRRFLVDNSLVPIEAQALSGDFNLIEGGVLDSVLILELVGFIEELLGVLLSPDDIVAENFSTLEGIVELSARLRR